MASGGIIALISGGLLIALMTLVGATIALSKYYGRKRGKRKQYEDHTGECIKLAAEMKRRMSMMPDQPLTSTMATLNVHHVQPPTVRRQTLHLLTLPTNNSNLMNTTTTISTSTNNLGGSIENLDIIVKQDKNDNNNSRPPSPFQSTLLSNSARVSPSRRFSALPHLGDDHLLSPHYNKEDRRPSYVRTERFSIVEPMAFALESSSMDSSHAALHLYRSGKLCFTVHWNEEQSKLQIVIHKANYLPTSSAKQTSSYYIKACILPKEESLKTTAIQTNCNPLFEQTLTFPLDSEDVDSEEKTLQLTVKEAHHLEKNRIIGFVWLNLNREVLEETEKLEQIWRDVASPIKTSDLTSAELLVSLIWETKSGYLVVKAEEAKQLPVRPQDASVYVRISLMTEERVLRSKRTSSVKQNLVNPIMTTNNSVRFNMNTLAESLSPSSDLCVCCFVCSRSTMGFSHLLGKCVIGSVKFTDGDANEHWKTIWTEANSSLSKWHKLS